MALIPMSIWEAVIRLTGNLAKCLLVFEEGVKLRRGYGESWEKLEWGGYIKELYHFLASNSQRIDK